MLQECFCRGYNENCDWCNGSGRRSVQLAKPVYPALPTRRNKRTERIRCGFCGKSFANLAAHTQQKHPGHQPSEWKEVHPEKSPKAPGNAPVSAPGTSSSPARPVPPTPAAASAQSKPGRKSKGGTGRSITQIYEAMRERERTAAEEIRREREARARTTTLSPAKAPPPKTPAPTPPKPLNKIRFQGPLACPECTRQFPDLRAHLVAEHGWLPRSPSGVLAPPTEGNRLVRCPCCRDTSVRRDRLDRHLAKEHRIGDEPVAPARARLSPTRPARARAAAQAAAATLIVHRGTPGDASGRKPPAPSASPGQKKKKRKSGAKAGTSSTRRPSGGERKAYRAPASQEPGNFYQQEYLERQSDATRGLGYARRESGHWGSTVAFDDYGDESRA
jgi:predicted transcriptional regulator